MYAEDKMDGHNNIQTGYTYRIGEKRSVWNTAVKERCKLMDHILRHGGILSYIVHIVKDVGCAIYMKTD